MSVHMGLRMTVLAVQLAMLVVVTPVRAELDTSVLNNLKYDELQWLEDTTNPGSWYTVLSGDPSKPGPFLILNKVLQGNFMRPHLHSRAREIFVVDGTWWVGTGTTLNPANSVAKPEGSKVEHDANEVHWDGAKDEDVLLLIGGEGPVATEFIN